MNDNAAASLLELLGQARPTPIAPGGIGKSRPAKTKVFTQNGKSESTILKEMLSLMGGSVNGTQAKPSLVGENLSGAQDFMQRVQAQNSPQAPVSGSPSGDAQNPLAGMLGALGLGGQ